MQRLSAAQYILIAALLSCFAVAPRLWLDHPFFGTVPLFRGWPRFTFPFDYFALVLLITLLVATLFAPRQWRRTCILAWCLLFAIRCLGDRMTWQPFLYQYFFMLLTVGWATPSGRQLAMSSQARDGGHDRAAQAVLILRVIVASVYFWSGVSKFNKTFLTNAAMPGMLQEILPAPLAGLSEHAIVLIPIMETLIALGILFRRTRLAAVFGALFMHLAILGMTGPLGQSVNQIVWPWNIASMLLVIVLFAWDRGAEDWGRWRTPPSLYPWFVFIFVTVCPGLALCGWWNSYVSFQLYSASQILGRAYMTQSLVDRLPEATRQAMVQGEFGEFVAYLDIQSWSEEELGAFAPSSLPVYRHVGRQLCRWSSGPGELALAIRLSPDRWTGESRFERLSCRELGVSVARPPP